MEYTNAIYNFSSILDGDSMSLGKSLEIHGFAIIRLDSLINDDLYRKTDLDWHDIFHALFALPQVDKEAAGPFRKEHDATLGYRNEEGREFFEVRLELEASQNGVGDKMVRAVNPLLSVPGYEVVVRGLFRALSSVAKAALCSVSLCLSLDASWLLGLTDLRSGTDDDNRGGGISGGGGSSVGLGSVSPHFSSTLLRICNYPTAASPLGVSSIADPVGPPTHPSPSPSPSASDSKQLPADRTPAGSAGPGPGRLLFGSHTDTSFVTVAPFSRTPGLEVMDLWDGSWHLVETMVEGGGSGDASPTVVVFTGECLQILTGGRFRAAVHRVRTYVDGSVPSASQGSTSSVGTETAGSCRLSCPLLVRGVPRAVVGNPDQHRRGVSAGFLAESDDRKPNPLPDLEGVSMKLVHTLLERARVRRADRRRRARNAPGEGGDRGATKAGCVGGEDECFEEGEEEEEDWVLSAYDVVLGVDVARRASAGSEAENGGSV